ncbi:MAG: T9SS type A sorting domain-containing protein [Bacteroidia bacterium]
MKIKLSVKHQVSQSLKQKSKLALAGAMGGFAIIAFMLFFSYYNVGVTQNVMAAPGKDGAKSIGSPNVILNEYTSLIADAATGINYITVANAYLNSNGRFASTLSSGDLIMIIQMQGAGIGTTNNQEWGSVNSYNNAGNFEFAEVLNVPSASKITLKSGISKSYTSSGKVQVIRIPRYSSLTIAATGSVTAAPWDGSTGGIVAAEVNQHTTLNGSINADGQGFRGGVVEQNASLPGNHTTYASVIANDGAEKGEGIAGYQATYDGLGGRYGRGAPANGGGGGNSHNSSGGGGGNAGNILLWDGLGNPDNSTSGAKAAWNLESGTFSSHTSTGGGRGGYAYSSNSGNPLADAPGNPSWGGDNRCNVGGLGGRPLDYSTGKIFMGGGGGAGDSDDSTGTSGARGGGLIYIISGGTFSGKGTVSANGANGATTEGPQGWDGTGGGGGGGTIIIYSRGAISNISINAEGGKGGNQNLTDDAETEGTGGGGGGGYISLSNAIGVVKNVRGGSQGITNASTVAAFTPNGGTKGYSGVCGPPPSFPYSSGSFLPVDLTFFTGEIKNDKVELKWTTSAEINNDYFTIEKSTDGIIFSECGKIEGAGNTTTVREYSIEDVHPAEGINYYRLKQTVFNGRTEYFRILSVSFQVEAGDVFEIKEIHPNPFKEGFTVDFNADAETNCEFDLLDLNGKIIDTQKFTARLGFNSFHFTADNNIPKGVYYLRLTHDNISARTVRLVKA